MGTTDSNTKRETTSSAPSPVSHLYRLGLALVALLFSVFAAAVVFAPATWNYEIANWYRLGALDDLQKQPPAYGGIVNLKISKRNTACKSCHKDEYREVKKFHHKRLSCESCHGALTDHVQDDNKIADAFVDNQSRWQCLNCHAPLISRPINFPQFTTLENIKHRQLKEETLCVECHNPHDPTR